MSSTGAGGSIGVSLIFVLFSRRHDSARRPCAELVICTILRTAVKFAKFEKTCIIKLAFFRDAAPKYFLRSVVLMKRRGFFSVIVIILLAAALALGYCWYKGVGPFEKTEQGQTVVKPEVKQKAAEVKQKAVEAKDKAVEKAKEVGEKAKDKAVELKDKAKEKAAEVKEAVKEKAADVKEAVKEKAAEVKEKVVEKAGELKDKAVDKAKDLAGKVTGDKPAEAPAAK